MYQLWYYGLKKNIFSTNMFKNTTFCIHCDIMDLFHFILWRRFQSNTNMFENNVLYQLWYYGFALFYFILYFKKQNFIFTVIYWLRLVVLKTHRHNSIIIIKVIIIIITFIHFVFISTNINQYISNIMKIELQNKSIFKIFEYAIQLQNE